MTGRDSASKSRDPSAENELESRKEEIQERLLSTEVHERTTVVYIVFGNDKMNNGYHKIAVQSYVSIWHI